MITGIGTPINHSNSPLAIVRSSNVLMEIGTRQHKPCSYAGPTKRIARQRAAPNSSRAAPSAAIRTDDMQAVESWIFVKMKFGLEFFELAPSTDERL
jgi:hypothetical protein